MPSTWGGDSIQHSHLSTITRTTVIVGPGESIADLVLLIEDGNGDDGELAQSPYRSLFCFTKLGWNIDT